VQACYALFGAAAGSLAPGPRVVRAINATSGVGIGLFGVYGLARVL
jgi:threonine/homoserine/homoserine lactone efflux protein